MKTSAVLALLILIIPAPGSAVDRNGETMKIGPALSFGSFGDLSEVSGLLAEGLPGVELAVRLAKPLEVWGAYKFSKTEYRLGHGTDRVFRFDSWAGGLRYKPFRLGSVVPFAGIGLNYYHFADGMYSPFFFPLDTAIGPYVQGGFYLPFKNLLRVQCAFRYNQVRHCETRTTAWNTYHYRTDFSGLEGGVGLLFILDGK